MTNTDKKSSMYIIERGVPTPCHPNRGKWASIVSKMNDGDSIVVADIDIGPSIQEGFNDLDPS